MTLEEAIAEVTLHAQTDAFPTLTPDQVLSLVKKNQRATIWASDTEYKIGDVVQPTVPNGHFYRRRSPGTSTDAEPAWTRIESKTVWEPGTGDVWIECGQDLDGNLYNTRNAIYDAWMLKASIVVKDFDAKIDNQEWKRSQIYEHCLEMARAWSPFD